MHNPKLALECLDIQLTNCQLLSEKTDLFEMPHEEFEKLDPKTPIRPFRLSAWLTYQASLIAGWSLWEYYCRNLLETLPVKVKPPKGKSTVEWVQLSLLANSKAFTEFDWFSNANSIRNLIVHNGGRVVGLPEQAKFAKGKLAFPELRTWKDGYLDLNYDMVADLHCKVDEFIRETA